MMGGADSFCCFAHCAFSTSKRATIRSASKAWARVRHGKMGCELWYHGDVGGSCCVQGARLSHGR